MWRECFHSLQHLIEGQVVQPGEAHPVRKLREVLLECPLPILLDLRGPDDAHDVGRVWRQLQDILHEAWQVEAFPHKSRISFQCAGWQPALIHSCEKNGSMW